MLSLYSIEFDRFGTDVVGAFIRFFNKFLEIFEDENDCFANLTSTFAEFCHDDQRSSKKIRHVTNYSELYQHLYNAQFCNWFNFEIVEKVSRLYKQNIPKVDTFTKEYASYLYPKKLKDVLPCLKNKGIKKDHFEQIKFQLSHNPNAYTVGEAKHLLNSLKSQCGPVYLLDAKFNCIQMECIVPKISSFKTFAILKKISVALRNLHIHCVSMGDNKAFAINLDWRKYPLEDYRGKCMTVCILHGVHINYYLLKNSLAVEKGAAYMSNIYVT